MLTDEEIIEIRDEHLPSQGERFDCITFARAIEQATAKRCAEICQDRSKGALEAHMAEAMLCAAHIRFEFGLTKEKVK